MIFLTIGTTKFPFDRLIKAVDEAVLELKLKEELIIQKGVSDYQVKHTGATMFREIPYDRMVENFIKARVIITAGGPATIFLALKYGNNKPLVVPRSGKLGEHVDEHEVLFGKFLSAEKKCQVILPGENLVSKITLYLRKPMCNDKKGVISVSSRLIKGLINLSVGYAK